MALTEVSEVSNLENLPFSPLLLPYRHDILVFMSGRKEDFKAPELTLEEELDLFEDPEPWEWREIEDRWVQRHYGYYDEPDTHAHAKQWANQRLASKQGR